ncbi:MAG: hypothetical protein R3Y64_11200 [Peptostreptococcaceae bacterium]
MSYKKYNLKKDKVLNLLDEIKDIIDDQYIKDNIFQKINLQ